MRLRQVAPRCGRRSEINSQRTAYGKCDQKRREEADQARRMPDRGRENGDGEQGDQRAEQPQRRAKRRPRRARRARRSRPGDARRSASAGGYGSRRSGSGSRSGAHTSGRSCPPRSRPSSRRSHRGRTTSPPPRAIPTRRSTAIPSPATPTSASGQQPDEEPVGERARHDPAADLRVAIGHLEERVDALVAPPLGLRPLRRGAARAAAAPAIHAEARSRFVTPRPPPAERARASAAPA